MFPPLHEFIWQQREADPARLVLSAAKYPGIPMAYVAAQVKALQKLRDKIPSWYRAGLEFPSALSIEQASSEATAGFKAALFSGNKMADLTGGMGIDAYFFAQRFESLDYVEQNAELQAAARHNFTTLGTRNVSFHTLEAGDFLRRTQTHYDLIYLDPARRNDRKGKVFQLADCAPNILEIKNLALEKSDRILLKTAPMLDLHLAATQLQSVVKIWVVSLRGECREVLYLLEREAPPIPDIPIEVVLLDEQREPVFRFTAREEQQADVSFSAPGRYLYEPDAAILKAGAFRSFARRYGLKKLHPNTHLYTSDAFVAAPGRRFEIISTLKYDKKSVLAALSSPKAHITCRNFPDSPDQVRKKLGLADGGDVYLFAVTLMEDKKVLLIGRKAG
ncbi:MAG: SAM-dependent methyltransferase [Saprospiraceae bacterium]|nr:SAM-dependent methyltransferase [Saprospiraceae bacterium]